LIEQAYRGRKSSVMTLAVNPRFDPLREDPRLDEFMERAGLQQPTAAFAQRQLFDPPVRVAVQILPR